MSSIRSDHEMKSILDGLDDRQQRLVGGRFVEQVMDLCLDPRIQHSLHLALDPEVSPPQIKALQKTVAQAILDGHARCGAEGDWQEQSSYFVARALGACLSPRVRKEGKAPAWQAALSCRMARTSAAIDQDSDSPLLENTKQYDILSSYLDNSGGASHE
jgi:hypothetical protein